MPYVPNCNEAAGNEIDTQQKNLFYLSF